MYILRGFVTMPALMNNAVGQNSPIGELEPQQETYSRERGVYANNTYPDVRLVSFRSEDTTGLIPVNTLHQNKALMMSQWLYARSLAGQISEDKTDTLLAMRSYFVLEAEEIDLGDTVTNGQYWFPSWVSYKALGAPDNEVRLWYHNASFAAQYDYYDIIVVPPIVDPEAFHTGVAAVDQLLDEYLQSEHMARAQLARAGTPPTYQPSYEFDWVNPNDATYRRRTNWVVLVYGIRGNNDDLIKEKIADHLLDASAYDRDAWETIFPEIFIPTEYYIVPAWNRYALPELTLTAGIYSPSIPQAELPQYQALFVDYATPHILAQNEIIGSSWKGLSFVSVGHHRNRNGLYRLTDQWPDYVNIPVNSLDYNRISPATRSWINQLFTAFIYAEQNAGTLQLPEGYTLIDRNGVFYVSFNRDQIKYLIARKDSLPDPVV
jgi:hypothetical protein